MTDNEIIKALESEIRSTEYVDSDYCDGVDLTLMKSAIDLIKRQKAEIENAKAKIKICAEVIERQDTEIERLKSANDEKFCQWDMLAEKTKQHYADLYNETKDILKFEAYKDFAEQLKEEWFNNYYDSPDVDFDEFVDNLLKEMVGE